MADMNNEYSVAVAATQSSAPIATAPVEAPAAAVTVHPAVTAIVQVAQAQNPPADWAASAAAYIQALDPIIQAVEATSRAGAKTQTYISIAEVATPVLAGILQRLFIHPKA